MLLCLCAAFTPLTAGPDAAEVAVPYDPADGVTSIAWTLRWIGLRVQTAGGAPAVTIEKSSGTGVFTPTSVGTVTLGAGASEAMATAGLGTVNSGDKMRFNVVALGTASNWTVAVELGR